jgi:hypothetical protein
MQLSRLAVVLLLAAALCIARASRDLDDSSSNRQLLQTPTSADCDRSVKHCTACRYQFYRGTVTKVWGGAAGAAGVSRISGSVARTSRGRES